MKYQIVIKFETDRELTPEEQFQLAAAAQVRVEEPTTADGEDMARRDCVACIDKRLDPDAVENITLTVSLNEARTILAALSNRCDKLESLSDWPQRKRDQLLTETKAVYQSIDRQAFQVQVEEPTTAYQHVPAIHHLGHCPLPNYEMIVRSCEDLK